MKKSTKKLFQGLALVVVGGLSGYFGRPLLEERFPMLKGKTTTAPTPALPSGSQAATGQVDTTQYAGGSNSFDESANVGPSLPDFSV